MADLPRRVRAALMRGGTSKGLVVRARDLPASPAARDECLLRAMGSPDPHSMQMDGVGGGITSSSKAAVVTHPSSRAWADADYLFAQVPVRGGGIDWSGSCGNMAAAVGLYAVSEGLCEGRRRVRLWQANLGHEIAVTVAEEDGGETAEVAGVPGRAPRIDVEFIDPCRGAAALPTGSAVDALALPGGCTIDATLVRGVNPTVFVRANDLPGVDGAELPAQLAAGMAIGAALRETVDDLRRQGAALMGVELSSAVRLAWLAPPDRMAEYDTTGGAAVAGADADMVARISAGARVHHAFTGTGAINLAAAAAIPGTVPHCLLGRLSPPTGALRVLHPGGLLETRAEVERNGTGEWLLARASLVRTARYLFSGEVHIR